MLSQLGITMVFDVGAHIGHIGEYATRLRHIGYRGRIISFEPQAAAFAVLANKAIGDPLWNAERLALGNRVGELAQNKAETVPVTSLAACRIV
jgi:FkbM family methyltransferase